MLSATVRISKRGVFLTLAVMLVIGLISFELVRASAQSVRNADTIEKRIAAAAGFGYNISTCEEIVNVIYIPESSGNVFSEYNRLQKCCGFDLSDNCGSTVERYSYTLEGSYLIVSLLVSDGRLVGGDLYDTESCKYISLCGEE